MEDERGLKLSTGNRAAADFFNSAMDSYLMYRTTAMSEAKEAVAADGDFCLAHCLQGYLYMAFGTFSVLDAARSAHAQAVRSSGSATGREKRHVEALGLWIKGDLERACTVWEGIFLAHPHDILALRLHHFNNFWMGRAAALRAGPASVLKSWDSSVPRYGNVLGMLAFGYEECGEYRLAERHGRQAVEHSGDDLWAVHAVSHVLEMEGRHGEGMDWLRPRSEAWANRNPFKGHLWWHLALFYLESGRYGDALALYDAHIYQDRSDFFLDIQNAASLLARLDFVGVDLGDRWSSLADHAEGRLHDHALVFTDIHCMMSLAHEKRFDAAESMLRSMQAHAADPDRYASKVVKDIAVPLCQGLIAFERKDYDRAFDHIQSVRGNLGPIGASHAQRDILQQYLVEAAMRGSRSAEAKSLLAERIVLKPNSYITGQKYESLSQVLVPGALTQ